MKPISKEVTVPREPNSPAQEENETLVLAAKEKCRILYDGVQTGHRSCGIAIAETFDLPTASYQALRRGGLTGQGPCGAIQAGRLVLGELLGDPDPTGAATPQLKNAVAHYELGWPKLPSLETDGAQPPDIVCNSLTSRFPIFKSPERHAMCTRLAHDVAGLVSHVLNEVEHPREISPIHGVDDFDPKAPGHS